MGQVGILLLENLKRMHCKYSSFLAVENAVNAGKAMIWNLLFTKACCRSRRNGQTSAGVATWSSCFSEQWTSTNKKNGEYSPGVI